VRVYESGRNLALQKAMQGRAAKSFGNRLSRLILREGVNQRTFMLLTSSLRSARRYNFWKATTLFKNRQSAKIVEQKIVAAILAVGVALMAGALVQVYYSDLPPLSPWSGPAVYSFLGVILLFIAWWLFW